MDKQSVFEIYDKIDSGKIDAHDLMRLVSPSECAAFLKTVRSSGREIPDNEVGDKVFTYLVLSISGHYS